MTSRAAMNLATGDPIPESWTDAIKDSVISSTTSVDTTAEAQISGHTTQDRFWSHNGTSQVRLPLWYSSAGRTWCTKNVTFAGSWLNNTLTDVQFAGGVDDDSMYQGFTGTHYTFVIPSGLDGIWRLGWSVKSNVSGGTEWWSACNTVISGTTEVHPVSGVAGQAYCGTGMVEIAMAAGDQFYFVALQSSGGTRTSMTGRMSAVWTGP